MWHQGILTFPLADGNLGTTRQEHCIPLMIALTEYTKSVYGETSKMAAGTRSDQKGHETFYVEHEISGSKVIRLEIGATKVRASVANPVLANHISAISDMADIAAATWFAYLHMDPQKNLNADYHPNLKDMMELLHNQIEADAVDDFELQLTNFETKCMTLTGPITGAETSLPVLDKRVKGPQKIICGTFKTFPSEGKAAAIASGADRSRNAIKDYILDSPQIREYRKRLTPEQLARVPDVRPSHRFSDDEIYMYQVQKETELDSGDLAVHVHQITGPAAAGKSEAVEQNAAENGLPFYSLVGNESTRISDWLDQWVPYLTGGSMPSLTEEEKAVNNAMKSDTEGRDALSLAIEALGLPSQIEVKFDPDYAWECLGNSGPAAPSQEIIAKIEEKAKEILGSLKEKLSAADGSGTTLAYKCVPSPLVSWLKGGGILEIGEMATMRKGELSKLHDLLDFNRRGSIMTAEGEIFRHEMCYVFLTNNLEYDEDHPLTLPMISRMSLDIEFPQLTEEEAVDRLVSVLNCQSKRGQAKDLVHAYVALGKEATNLSLPGGIDFRNLKQVGNRILMHDFDPRTVFEKEVIHHFVQHSDPESKIHNETALMSLLDELDLFA